MNIAVNKDKITSLPKYYTFHFAVWLTQSFLLSCAALFQLGTLSFTDLDQGREILSRFNLPKSMKHSVEQGWPYFLIYLRVKLK